MSIYGETSGNNALSALKTVRFSIKVTYNKKDVYVYSKLIQSIKLKK